MSTPKDQTTEESEVQVLTFEEFGKKLGGTGTYTDFNDNVIEVPETATEEKKPTKELEEKSSLNTEKKPEEDKEKEAEVATAQQAVTEVTEEPESSKNYRKILKDQFGKKVEKIAIEEDGKIVEYLIDELVIDEDTFKSVLKGAIDQDKEEGSANKISIEGVSDFTKKLIEIDQNKGDVRELLQIQQATVNPLSELDMTTEYGKKQAMYILHRLQKLSEDESERLVNSYIQDGSLDQKSENAVTQINTGFEALVERKRAEAAENKKKAEENLKTYKTGFKESLGEYFVLNDTTKTKLANMVSVFDDKGNAEIDRLWMQNRWDSKMSAKVALFLADPDEYDRQVSTKKVTEKQLGTGKLIKLIRTPEQKSAELNREKEDGSTVLFENIKVEK